MQDIWLYDESLRSSEGIVAGLDEAGRGPIAGPVVASAVILPPGIRIEGLRDSKKVPEKERETLFRDIVCLASHIGVGIVDNVDIDKINILNATRLAMTRALEDLSASPSFLVIDAVRLSSVKIRQLSPFKAESLSASVAAASIVAKFVRDSIMIAYHLSYPQYGFDKNKGYGTRDHIRSLELNGPCPIHRKTFAKVMDVPLPL